jgi:hypothetical protein
MKLRLVAAVDPRTQILLRVAESNEISEFFKNGPFDGDCLMAAKAIMEVWGGNLVRIDWDTDSDPEVYTLHYGVEIGGKFLDFAGVFKSAQAWIKNFRKMEEMLNPEKILVVRPGLQPDWDELDDRLPNDPEAIAGVADLIRKYEVGR